ncbi:MAG: DegT/DnrJ/EryC1/StrS aminotransferase family protein [Oscillospiraceae bacterium]
MEFRDLKKQYQVLKEQIDAAMIDVAANGTYIMGNLVKELEDKLAEYVGVKHCITCANGTDALSLVLMAWGIGCGDAVFVPDFTFFASAEVVSSEGATPVFVDVDERTFNIDPEKLEQEIIRVIKDGRLMPKAIIAVDLFGLPANYPEIERIAEKYGLLLLEDGAQGFGGNINGKKSCSFGNAATTSFFPAKPLGCYGDGGAVFTNDDHIAEYISSAKFHGKGTDKYDNVRIGINSRLDTIQAAVLKPKFDAFKAYELENVNQASRWYCEELKGIVKTPITPEGFYSSYAQYTIILEDQNQRNALQSFLKARDIPAMVYYPKPMHMQSAFSCSCSRCEDFPVSTKLCDCVLSLPMHPYLQEEDALRVTTAIKEFFNGSVQMPLK